MRVPACGLRCEISTRILFLGDSLTEGSPGVSTLDILEALLPDCSLINWGRGGDSAPSLYQRLQTLPFPTDIEIAFLWVGVNDVFLKVSPSFGLLRRLRNQHWSANQTEFEASYRKLLAYLQPRVRHVVTVSPLFIGEQLDNLWNRALESIIAAVERISAQYYVSRYIPLREAFVRELAQEPSSDYLARSLAVIQLDKLLRTPQQVDAVSARRGRRFTLDGVHLNSRGANIVAEIFYQTIQELLQAAQPPRPIVRLQ